jgi:hypothetical protein
MLLTAPPSKQLQLGDILEHVGGVLDISEDLYMEAVTQYEAVGAHLARPESRLAIYAPRIYPQGSFPLGTMIQPALSGCEYDVDLVCLINLAKAATTQADLKNLVGCELRLAYAKILGECRRCWTLQFKLKFHMDVLPSIPDADLGGTAILLTDTDLIRWQHSDPKAYLRWFHGRMATVLYEMKKALALKLRASVEHIPDWRVRTPLQRAVQLLKRHRDLFFRDDLDQRPASIIITTLAGTAYGGQPGVLGALEAIVATMPAAVALRDGAYQILNPVNPKENFADKWNEDPRRARQFLTWASAVKADLAAWTATTAGVHQLSESLAPRFGADVVKKALAGYGESIASTRQAGALAMAVGSGKLIGTPTSTSSVPVRPHTFCGE